MQKVQVTLLVAILSLMLLTFTHSASLPEAASTRNKRQSADVRTAEYLAWIALGGKVPSRGCEQVACGVVDVYTRFDDVIKERGVRRSSADQRIAELQALLALSGGRGRGRSLVAHGLFDPDAIGKKKRTWNPQSEANLNDEERYNLLKALVQKAAIDNTAA